MFALIGAAARARAWRCCWWSRTWAQSLEIADRAYVLENGAIRFEGRPDELLASDGLRRAYLGL
jgi:ABC-type transporter Mla maintaining outer membrane lipid asymmetry ATPase subunit MlaF